MNVFGNIKLKESQKKVQLNFKNPFEVFKSIYHNTQTSFLLESMESDSGLSRYSMLGFEPEYKITANDTILTIENEDFKEEIETENPFELIKELIQTGTGDGFKGALVGYISYESVRHFENLSLKPSHEPDFQFGLYTDCVVFDRLKQTCDYLTVHNDRSNDIKQVIKQNSPETKPLYFKESGKYFTKRKYCGLVEEAKQHIKAGEIFQIVLSNATSYKIKGDKLYFFEKLRQINPSPYMYHLKMGEREIIGSSPEMLVRVKKQKIETFPIAGTRHRGRTKKEDLGLENELLNDEKELAEHLMLLDLARNDIGQVSKIGTVKIPEYMNVKKFSHVQHIVSRVEGQLAPRYNAIDAFASVFPAGTVSGAPKIRAMDIIDSLEKNPRGPYAGAVGYFSLNGNADFAITIRTLECHGSSAKIQAGAGIVHDSVPEKEYEECNNKAQALISAMEMV